MRRRMLIQPIAPLHNRPSLKHENPQLIIMHSRHNVRTDEMSWVYYSFEQVPLWQ